MERDTYRFENRAREQGFSIIAGVDEAGRGPLAGPVVSAAVILPEAVCLEHLDDSKRLSPARREALFGAIYEQATSVGIGLVDAVEIDRINILQAALLSMAMAIANLRPTPEYLLIDGPFPVKSTVPQKAVKHGDRLSSSIAAASIVAKVTRDRLMRLYDEEFPGFGFAKHKGYGTKAHRTAIRTLGCCPIHRKTFRGVKEHVDGLDGEAYWGNV
ncbi:MAG: ribonuclease HII [Thermodesulfobacteriota bacterium]|nr:ribonuclease HII [Thermodesulfobacteriota bacterium]